MYRAVIVALALVDRSEEPPYGFPGGAEIEPIGRAVQCGPNAGFLDEAAPPGGPCWEVAGTVVTVQTLLFL